MSGRGSTAASSGLDSTYEGLKLMKREFILRDVHHRLDSTYEGLKRQCPGDEYLLGDVWTVPMRA